jgi:class 3 adenylate cyclase
MVEGILLSLGLADRIRRLSDQVAEQRLAEVRMKRQQEEERRTLIEQQNAELESKVATRTADLTHERERTESLLRNILPASVADELKASGVTVPRRFEETSILFTDFAGFTEAMGTMPGARMVAELNEIFAAFDDIIDRRCLEKIKTIGDAYLAAAGLPEPAPDHAARCVRAALDMVAFIEQRNEHSSIKWGLRVGIHSGPVVAGVVGKRKYAYDIWGDTVNIASRMESAGEPGRVNLSAYTYDLVRDQFDCEYRGKVGAKGKGEVDMYFAIAEKINGLKTKGSI